MGWAHRLQSFWIRSYKGRNGVAQNLSVRKNTKFGRALRVFLREYDQNPVRNAEFEYLASPYKQVTSRFNCTWNFHHLAFSGHQEGLSIYGASDANLKVLKDMYAVVTESHRRAAKARYDGKTGNLHSKNLKPSAISQSHVYAEEAKRGAFAKSATMDKTYDREDTDENTRDALNQFHTPEVRENVYRARSRDKKQLRKGRAFAIAVSAEMVSVAEDIIDGWERNTNKLSVAALIDVIGLRGSTSDTPPETILAAAKAEKFIIEKSGLIKKNGTIYLFDSGLTARMMMEEIRHIEGELEGLFRTQDVDKALNAWTKLCFLELLLERFSAVSLKDASEKYGHLEGKIPHAPTSEGGNSWIVE